MAMQTFTMTPARLGKYKGDLIKRAVPKECLGRAGRHLNRSLPKNSSDTYVGRRFLPHGATSTNANTQNRFFVDGTGDRGNTYANQHLVAEGVTPQPDSITPVDFTVVINQYAILYGFTDKMFYLYEDQIPEEMVKQVGERMGLVNEMILYGALRACTNVYFGGTGTTIATVNGGITLGLLRKVTKNLQANHAMPVNSMLGASAKYNTEAVEDGYTIVCHTNAEPDIRDLPGFTEAVKYASGTPMPNEIGKVERMRFITSPDLPELQDAGAAIGVTNLISTSGSNIDVYPMIVFGESAWSQLAVRGLKAVDPTYIAPGTKSPSDPFGQRGLAGTIWWKAAVVENHGWMALVHVGLKNLA